MNTKKGRRVYLDYAATTPVDPLVVEAMRPYWSGKFGNMASIHQFGREVKQTVDGNREVIAGALGAKSNEIYFTSSATESNNLAIKGVMWANQDRGKHLVVSAVEHDCVIESARWLAGRGMELSFVRVDKFGMVDSDEVSKLIRKDTVLVSVIHGNNEVGTINPIGEIGRICREKGVYFHTDAAQSFGKAGLNVGELKVDLLTASAHKMYGPKGVAVLYKRQGIKMTPLLHGGGHEGGLRSSTVNTAGVVGLAKAVELCAGERLGEAERLTKLRDRLIAGVLGSIPGGYLNGHAQKRLFNNVSLRFDFVEGEALTVELDARGIAASTASACASPKLEPSHVLLAMGVRPEEAHGSLRLSLGRWTTEEEIDYVLEVLPRAVERLRRMSPFKHKGVGS